MPIVLITFFVGVAVGYWLCRMQLRGKFLLAEERQPLPPSWRPPPPEYAPTATLAPAPALTIRPTGLVSKRAPHGFSAKQVLGYNAWGYIRPPQYPGGIQMWDVNVNGISTEEDR